MNNLTKNVIPQTKGEKRRAEILALARRVLINESFDLFSLRDIATKANMKLGNLQYYFPTRDKLLLEVIAIEAQRDIQALDIVLAKQMEPVKQLESFCKILIDRWRGDSGKIFLLMSFLAQQNAAFSLLYQQVYDNFYSALVPILAKVDPGRRKATYLQRAMLVTALIDGAPGQLTRGNKKRFLEQVANEVLHIANHQNQVTSD